MKDVSDTPFWGKQKPLKHYFKNGLIKFSIRKNELWFHVNMIHKDGHYPLFGQKVKDKEHLDRLLRVKDVHEFIPHLV